MQATAVFTDAEHTLVRADTIRWLERAVIGLNLCPFAKSVHAKGQIHYAVTPAHSDDDLLNVVEQELLALHASDPSVRDTTVLIAPKAWTDFSTFNDFLILADMTLRGLRLEGVLQIASFHPHFQFDGVEADDITNYTNRAPYPMLHLLRESSIEKAVAAFPQAELIYERNMTTLQSLGHSGWAVLELQSRVPGHRQKKST